MTIDCISSERLRERIDSGGEFVAVFSTKWCGFCRALMSELERSQVDFVAVEVDISSDDDPAWERFGVSAVPTAVLFSSGREVARKSPGYDGLRVKDLKSLYDRSRA
ncbi:MAG TPA: thioredoxin family protein [Candidatus Methanomethylicus sp.]|nr:thioredoxin family protein [Candidatus Methanomethylicus sp.]HRR53713.1 thioredoxin family protein [Candidatus Methanomethylicus sp.]